MTIDAMTLASKVFERAMEKSGHLGLSSAGMGAGGQTDVMVDALASYLLQFLGVGAPVSAPDAQPSRSDLERVCTEQSLRNRAVARALGACECWGEFSTCEVCRGRGVPGWRPPERVSFDLLIRPLLHKMKQQRIRARRAPKTS